MNELARPLVVIVVAVLALLLAFMAGLAWYGHWYEHFSGADKGVSDGRCNIAVVPIQGDIVSFEDPTALQYGGSNPASTSGDWVEHSVHNAVNDPNILGILVPIDSYGGLGAAGSQMRDVLRASPIPIVAYIRDFGTSAAYIAALGAGHIIANPFASVGSIGVTYSYLDNSQKNAKEGVQFIQLSSGPYKDTGSPDKPLTDVERKLYERDIAIFKSLFVQIVAESRHLSTTTVEALADGDSWPASLALQKGLIDEVGSEETARAWFAEQLGLSSEQVEFCN